MPVNEPRKATCCTMSPPNWSDLQPWSLKIIFWGQRQGERKRRLRLPYLLTESPIWDIYRVDKSKPSRYEHQYFLCNHWLEEPWFKCACLKVSWLVPAPRHTLPIWKTAFFVGLLFFKLHTRNRVNKQSPNAANQWSLFAFNLHSICAHGWLKNSFLRYILIQLYHLPIYLGNKIFMEFITHCNSAETLRICIYRLFVSSSPCFPLWRHNIFLVQVSTRSLLLPFSILN